MSIKPVRDFVEQDKPKVECPFTAVSLFSGAGLSDLGYEMAGFRFLVQVETDKRRAAVGARNFPNSEWLTLDVCKAHSVIQDAAPKPLDLLTATPPCQGMSSSNPGRGKRKSDLGNAQEEKNRLLLEVIPVADLLKPRVIVIENVRQVLTLDVEHDGKRDTTVSHLRNGLSNYAVFPSVVNVADYGVPQVRRRALIVAVRKDEACLEGLTCQDRPPIPQPTHAEQPVDGEKPWVSIGEWLQGIEYEPLDAKSKDAATGEHPLHFVPAYGPDRYRQISEITKCSGRSAYENDACPECGRSKVEVGLIRCPDCDGVMRNRPYVERDGGPSLIKGFKSSYRRMSPNRPSYTITTNSSHVGSDFKIHPWENRVLSILECADLQTVPRFYNWRQATEARTLYLIRNLIGEAFPPYFTYLHGQLLAKLLSSREPSLSNGAAPYEREVGRPAGSTSGKVLQRA